jgi:subtilisin family serine protease
MKKLETLVAALLLFGMSATAQTTVSPNKLSPWLAQHIADNASEHSRAAQDAKPESITQYLDVLVKLTDGSDESLLEKYNAKVNRRIGSVLIVSIPSSQVVALAEDPQVVRVEAERMPHPMLDCVPTQIGADLASDIYNGHLPQAFTGKDVIVGIVDAGFDYIHPFFRDANGKTRITWAADYLTGKQYTTTEAVTAAMHSSDATKMYHGTHVAAIAAGSRVKDADWVKSTVYQGIATEADIAEGAISSKITVEGLSSVTSVMAFSDIFEYATQQGKPCVINYSLGDAMSFVNNRQLEEEAINTLLATPGRAIVVAAGNAGGTARLAYKRGDAEEGGCGVCFNDYEQYGTYFGVEMKVSPGQSVRLRYTDSTYKDIKAEAVVSVEELAAGTAFQLGNKRIISYARGKSEDGYDVFYLTAGITATYKTTERILITVTGYEEAWIYADPLCAQLENVDTIKGHSLAKDGYSMAWPAMMPHVISVGNIAHRFQIVTMANKYASSANGTLTPTDLTDIESTKGEGYLARSSSVGPTLIGTIKPDVCAPGVNVVSAQNFFIDDDTYYSLAGWDIAALDTDYETWGGLSGYFHIMAQTGTSMSAPAVTGAIALWLQANPSLTVDEIKDIIANSSRRPDATLSYPNNQYGHGEIDVYAGLLYMLGVTAISDVSRHQPEKTTIRLEGRQLHISVGEAIPADVPIQGHSKHSDKFTVKIYSTDGRLLLTANNQNVIGLDHLPQGIYAVQVTTSNRQTTGSTLIRL